MFERDSCSSGPLVGASADASEAVGGEDRARASLWRAKQSVGVVGDRPSSGGSSTTAVCSEAAFVGAPGDTGFFAVAALVSLSRFTGSVAPSSSAPARAPSGGASARARLRDIRGGRARRRSVCRVACPSARDSPSRVRKRRARGNVRRASRARRRREARGARPSRRPASASLVSSARPIGEGRVVSKGSSRARARARRRSECRRKGPRSLSKTSKTAIRHEALGAWWTF